MAQGLWRLALLAAAVAVGYGIWRKPWKKAAWKPLSQPSDGPPVPKVLYGRHYFFFTHHKTGTNLMQRFCNITAMRTTGNEDQCAFCLRLAHAVKGRDGYLLCEPNPNEVHGRNRGTFDRFTLVSSVSGFELKSIMAVAPDFRAVHMIRHPTKIALSAHAYNKFVSSEAGKKWRWDMSAQDIANATSTREELLIEAKAIWKVLRDMQGAHDLAKSDSRILTLELEDFEKDFDGTSARLFKHLFDGPPDSEIQQLITDAAHHDKKRWSKDRMKTESTAKASMVQDKKAVVAEWNKLTAEGQEDVKKVIDFIETMGYRPDGSKAVVRDEVAVPGQHVFEAAP